MVLCKPCAKHSGFFFPDGVVFPELLGMDTVVLVYRRAGNEVFDEMGWSMVRYWPPISNPCHERSMRPPVMRTPPTPVETVM